MHGALSLYWALGGRWLLNTVGAWAVDLADRAPMLFAVLLLVVAGVKIGGALCPLLNKAGPRLPGSARTWRRVFLSGAVLPIGYGGLKTIGAWIGIVLDHSVTASRLGHAALWDPLFLLWGRCCFWGSALPPTLRELGDHERVACGGLPEARSYRLAGSFAAGAGGCHMAPFSSSWSTCSGSDLRPCRGRPADPHISATFTD